VVTPEGMASTAVALEPSEQQTNTLWSVVRPMYQVPAITGLKGAVHTLLTLSRPVGGMKEPYPLICWQLDGKGKVMYIATDQLWRLRFKLGDKYHARFWGQTIQFLTLSRLMGDNSRVHLSANKKNYEVGQRISLFADVLNTSYEPIRAASYTLHLERDGGAKPEDKLDV